MPAVSRAQQRAMAIAKHHPERLFKRNRGLLRMTQGQLSDFARTSRKGLPARKKGLLNHRGKRPRERRTRKRRS